MWQVLYLFGLAAHLGCRDRGLIGPIFHPTSVWEGLRPEAASLTFIRQHARSRELDTVNVIQG